MRAGSCGSVRGSSLALRRLPHRQRRTQVASRWTQASTRERRRVVEMSEGAWGHPAAAQTTARRPFNATQKRPLGEARGGRARGCAQKKMGVERRRSACVRRASSKGFVLRNARGTTIAERAGHASTVRAPASAWTTPSAKPGSVIGTRERADPPAKRSEASSAPVRVTRIVARAHACSRSEGTAWSPVAPRRTTVRRRLRASAGSTRPSRPSVCV